MHVYRVSRARTEVSLLDTSQDRKQWFPVRAAFVAAVAVAVAVSLLPGARVARAATGDQLRQITAQVPACGSGVGTGVAFDGTHLLLSCWSSNVLQVVSPADGSASAPITIAGVTNIGAMAWDGSRGKLWVCQNGSDVYLADTVALSATLKFSTGGCIDGLAYDGSDDTIWASPDASSTLRHYKSDGTLLATFDLTGKLGNSRNSGIAVGGDKLYLANDGGSQIYQCTKDLVTCTLMSTFPRRIEDLECDNVTFAPKGAIWSIDAYDRILNAWEIPAGTCTFGGGQSGPPVGAPVRTATPTSTPAPKATATQPPTATPTPANTVLAAQVQPSGGAAAGVRPAVIRAPNTGTGASAASDGTASSGWLALLAVAGIATFSAGATLALRRRQ